MNGTSGVCGYTGVRWRKVAERRQLFLRGQHGGEGCRGSWGGGLGQAEVTALPPPLPHAPAWHLAGSENRGAANLFCLGHGGGGTKSSSSTGNGQRCAGQNYCSSSALFMALSPHTRGPGGREGPFSDCLEHDNLEGSVPEGFPGGMGVGTWDTAFRVASPGLRPLPPRSLGHLGGQAGLEDRPPCQTFHAPHFFQSAPSSCLKIVWHLRNEETGSERLMNRPKITQQVKANRDFISGQCDSVFTFPVGLWTLRSPFISLLLLANFNADQCRSAAWVIGSHKPQEQVLAMSPHSAEALDKFPFLSGPQFPQP